LSVSRPLHNAPQSATVIFSFLASPPPPLSTLFPYTTLFRSAKTETAAVKKQHKQTARQNPRRAKPKIRHLRNWPTPKKPLARRIDRKSTRLNSSHVKISYAVFCLKKKNTKNEHVRQSDRRMK